MKKVIMRGNVAHTKVHYQGTEDDFIVFVNDPEELKKWRNDKSIPLAEVVAGWKVFVTHKHGAQGKLDTASNASLENEFGTSREEDVVQKILEEGAIKESENAERIGVRNMTPGPMVRH